MRIQIYIYIILAAFDARSIIRFLSFRFSFVPQRRVLHLESSIDTIKFIRETLYKIKILSI